MNDSKKKILLKVFISEIPAAFAYFLFLFLFAIISILYGVKLDVILDLARYTLIPFFALLACQIAKKYTDSIKLKNWLTQRNYSNIKMSGFYGEMLSTAITNILKDSIYQKRKLSDELGSRKDYLLLWSHEIKTPLTSLKLMGDNNSMVPGDQVSEKVDQVNYQLQQLLAFDRIDSFSSDLKFEWFDLNQEVIEVVKQSRSFFVNRQITPDIDIKQIRVLSDRKWLAFALEQVIINSAKYSSEKSKVEILFKDNSLIVKDFGVGIASYELSRVFDKGFTGENGRTHSEATGMGLYMAKKIATELNIELTVHSSEGQGTQVVFVFPGKEIKNNKL